VAHMSCGRQQCRRVSRTPLFCRCGLEFCSEACFIPEWHAEHQKKCPHAAAIKAEVAEKQGSAAARGGAALLVATALSRTRPVVAPPVAAPEVERDLQDNSGAASSTASVAQKKPTPLRYSLSDFESVGAPLGGGSYGKVTKVAHKRTSEVFAMKVIPKQKVLEHQMTDYLAREVKTQLRLQHPNILRLLYYFEDSENVQLLLEFASGGSLFNVLKSRGRLTEFDAARYYTDVAMALDHLHNKGVVHRDLKPENILMCEGDVAKLADFGWCAEVDKGGAPRNTFCGTWDYLSPEMVQNEPHDHSVDIWAIGVLLYEMLTSRSPFAASSQLKALMRITKVDLQVPEHVSATAADLLRKLLVKEPHLRLSLAKSVQHEWVKQFIPDVAARLAESSAKNAAAVERSAVAAAEAAAVAEREKIEKTASDKTVAALRAAAEAALAAVGRRPTPPEGISLPSGLQPVPEPLRQEDGSTPTTCTGGSADAATEASESTPPVPAPEEPSPQPALVQCGPALSTMPWDRSPQDEKHLDNTTPRTLLASTSSLSSLSQSQMTVPTDGVSRLCTTAELPTATAALLRALHGGSGPKSTSQASEVEEEPPVKERLPEATANFLGALRAGSITGDLGWKPASPLSGPNLTQEALDDLSNPGSSVDQWQGSKQATMRGLREKIAERRAQLERERSMLEEEQQLLEQHELQLQQQRQVKALTPYGSGDCSPNNTSSPRFRSLAHAHSADGVLPTYTESRDSLGSCRSPDSLAAKGGWRTTSADLSTPRRTGSSDGTDLATYEEVRTWVRRKASQLAAPPGTGAAESEHVRSVDHSPSKPRRQASNNKVGDNPAAGGFHAGVAAVGDSLKPAKHCKWAGDDVDSTMSSVSSEISKDSRLVDVDAHGAYNRGLRASALTRSRQRMGVTVPSS